MAKMPKQKPGKSFQAYSTPRDFLYAVKKKFGVKAWAWDLAANKSNSVTNARHYFGPDHPAPACRNALSPDCLWRKLSGDLWLNPEYANIAPWAEKCSVETLFAIGGIRIFFLVPAAVGSNWWANYVHEKALAVFPRPRLSFDGKNPYPKDVALAIYGEKPGYAIWCWK